MNNKNLDKLENSIHKAASKATNQLHKKLLAIIDKKSKIKGKIKEATLAELEELLKFYNECFFVSKDRDEKYRRRKMKRLSNLELDTIVVEDFMNKNIRALLIKYNEMVYS